MTGAGSSPSGRGEPGRTSAIVAIDGMGGSGKTSLAVHAAHTAAADFPDGQLHIDLRGFTPGETPMTPAAALDSLLRALGTSSDHIPDDVPGRAALWRSTLAGRRVLLLLDNAADAAQVLPLLPASPGCLVLVTSRERLLDLDGADWLSVGPMSPEDGTLLIEEVLGRARVAAEPEAAEELVLLCGRLPLALRIVTARLRNRPRWTLSYLVDRLRDETYRLEELSAGERSVAATLQLSYQAMEEGHRTAFRVLGLHPGADVDAHAAAALLGTDTRSAETVLERLLDVQLLQQPDIGLYRFHDLVRTFAQSQSRPPPNRTTRRPYGGCSTTTSRRPRPPAPVCSRAAARAPLNSRPMKGRCPASPTWSRPGAGSTTNTRVSSHRCPSPTGTDSTGTPSASPATSCSGSTPSAATTSSRTSAKPPWSRPGARGTSPCSASPSPT